MSTCVGVAGMVKLIKFESDQNLENPQKIRNNEIKDTKRHKQIQQGTIYSDYPRKAQQNPSIVILGIKFLINLRFPRNKLPITEKKREKRIV